jgi:Ala-tRNA(Pro) deacylase
LTPASRNDLIACLDRLGIATTTVDHPPVFTVSEARSLRGQIAGGHAKNLFLKDRKGRLFLLVAEEDAAVDLKTIHQTLGGQGKVSFGSADLLREVWGVEPGSVTPFGAINDPEGRVTVALDAGLMAHATVNFHPLTNTATTSIASEDLVAFLRATGHQPLTVELGAPAGAQP